LIEIRIRRRTASDRQRLGTVHTAAHEAQVGSLLLRSRTALAFVAPPWVIGAVDADRRLRSRRQV